MIRRDTRRARLGFTLVELMIVIVIIGILMALLLPVIMGAIRKANDARLAAEIQTISTALAKFKNDHGEFPPSRVILSETGIYTNSGASMRTNGTAVGPVASDFSTPLASVTTWYGATAPTHFGSPDITFGELAQRSLRALRKYFPTAVLGPLDLNADSSITVTNDYWPDFNGNAGVSSTAPDSGFIYLEGHECLAFFLGGIPTPTVNGAGAVAFGMSGFGKEPRFPFKNAGVQGNNLTTANRAPSYFDFQPGRLVDEDGDGMPGYLDANASNGIGHFYAYFVSYGGGNPGYDPNDTNFGDDGDITISVSYRVGTPVYNGSGFINTTTSPTPNPYTTSPPTPASVNQPATYVNANGFQIISCGGDGFFGPGGQWVSSGDRLPDALAGQTGTRDVEWDNITNFTSGRLNP